MLALACGTVYYSVEVTGMQGTSCPDRETGGGEQLQTAVGWVASDLADPGLGRNIIIAKGYGGGDDCMFSFTAIDLSSHIKAAQRPVASK